MFAPRYFAPRYFPPRYFAEAGATPAVTNPDLLAAVVAQLRAYSSGAIPAAVGETGGVLKIWADEVLGSPDYPWVRVTEPMSNRDYSGDGNYLEHGQIQVDIFAAKRTQARQVGELITSPVPTMTRGALDGVTLTYTDGRLMRLVLRRAFFLTVPGQSPGKPAAYQRCLVFEYLASGQITLPA